MLAVSKESPIINFISVRNKGELRHLLEVCKDKNIKVIGNLTNTVIRENKEELIMIKLTGEFSTIQLIENQIIKVGGGVKISYLLNFCINNNLGGLEFLIGIPGTVGGAIYCNAGAFRKEIGDYVWKLICIDRNGKIKELEKNSINFYYRSSSIGDNIILFAFFKLYPVRREEIKDKMRKFLVSRFQSQDYHFPSWGCFFKNPISDNAGEIIQELNLKGKKKGNVWVSHKHGNFILTDGSYYFQDILAVKDMIQRKVWKEKRIWLEPEVEILW